MTPGNGISRKPATGRTAGGQGPVRVMIVDDSLMVRTAFSRMIANEPDLEIVATAGSAEAAIVQLNTTSVDVILLDLEMPGMGGLEALPRLLDNSSHAQVLVVSSLTEDGAEHTLAALSMGAADTMLKPQHGGFDNSYRESLLARIRALGQAHRSQGAATRQAAPSRVRRGKKPRLVAIGASTGGIHALNLLLRALPPRFDLPILVTQHLPASFISVFARQLEVASARKALIADDGTELSPGTIIVAPGHGHLEVRKRPNGLVARITIEPAASGCTPSVDPMLSSIADACDGEALGVMLSGMGRDGAIGARELFDAGGTILAQDRESSAVWGMPGAVVDAGLAQQPLPPEKLAAKIKELSGAVSWT